MIFLFKTTVLSRFHGCRLPMDQRQVYGLAKALLLAGGVVAIVLGGIDLVVVGLRGVGLGAVRPVIAVAAGVIGLLTLNEQKNEGIQLVLIVLGLVGGNAGGVLIAVAGVTALVGRYALGLTTSSQSTMT